MKKYITIIALLALSACGKKDTTPPVPGQAALATPAQNTVCTVFTTVNSTTTAVGFTWAAADNALTYDVVVKNLLTSATVTQSTSATSLVVNLAVSTPYSWYVVAHSASTTTVQSDVWKFYNPGPGATSHPPFPADGLKPTFAQSVTAGNINLSWTGADPDGDISGYDVYFGTAATPALYKANITDQFVNSVPVTAGSTYYWRVITKDSQGNTSDSGIFQFSAK